MKDYSAMSDFEINKEVDDMLHPPKPRHVKEYNSNYCNNPADAWPIIVANKISLDFDGDGYEPQRNAWCKASTQCGHVYYGSEKEPLRAAMIAYLQMMEQKS